jgi:hypothetical protein
LINNTTTSTTWVAPTGVSQVEYLVIAGGGGGGGSSGYTGGGGGGCPNPGMRGGSGVVIIRYLTPQ